MDNLYERTDFLERLCREYLNAFNMIRRLEWIRGGIWLGRSGRLLCPD